MNLPFKKVNPGKLYGRDLWFLSYQQLAPVAKRPFGVG